MGGPFPEPTRWRKWGRRDLAQIQPPAGGRAPGRLVGTEAAEQRIAAEAPEQTKEEALPMEKPEVVRTQLRIIQLEMVGTKVGG